VRTRHPRTIATHFTALAGPYLKKATITISITSELYSIFLRAFHYEKVAAVLSRVAITIWEI
jgi:hypothetical protein